MHQSVLLICVLPSALLADGAGDYCTVEKMSKDERKLCRLRERERASVRADLWQLRATSEDTTATAGVGVSMSRSSYDDH